MKTFIVVFVLFAVLLVGAVSAFGDWSDLTVHPGLRNRHAMAYIGDDQAVLFGGFDSGDDNETWVHDLSDEVWTNMRPTPTNLPSGRYGHAMAYLGGDQVVLFGGGSPPNDDNTYVYDLSANTWTQMAPAISPHARRFHAMAYLGGDQVLLFGGEWYDGAWVTNNETWVYDLSEDAWTQMAPATSPTARKYHAMAYLGGDQVVLFGGDDGARDDETWIYDLSAGTWTQMAPATSPSARKSHAMAYIGGDQVVLFGGDDGAYDDETWVYDLSGGTWTQMSPATSPSARYWHAIAYSGGDEVLLFGGWDGDFDDETWAYDLSADTWTQMRHDPRPLSREDHAMAFIASGKVLMFGGYTNQQTNETWIFDLADSTWTQMAPATKPSARYHHAMAYIGGDQVLLFGGAPFYNVYNNETWVYDLSANTWTQMAPATSPSARQDHGMAYIGGDQVLLFGGEDSTGFSNETWVYDLSADTWTQTAPAASPSARSDHAMAYLGGDEVLLFGGWDGDYNDETWVYDLSADTWTQVAPAASPSARRGHAMARLEGDQVLLFGGAYADDATWLYDHSINNWIQMMPTASPPRRWQHGLATIGGSQVLLYGGWTNSPYRFDDNWLYQSDLGFIAGSVNQAKGPIEGVVVTAVGVNTRFDTTDASGNYVIDILPPDSYDVTASAPGYHDSTQEDIAVLKDDTTWVVFSLQPADVSPPEAIDDLFVHLEGGAKSSSGDMRLIWSEPYDDIGVVRYVIYRSTDPDASGDSLAGTADTTYLDVGAAGDTLTHYFYVVKAVDAAGKKSAESNKVGEFDFQMVNGE